VKIDRSFFRSIVARRIFLFFVICALSPIIAMGALVVGQVTDTLNEEKNDRLQQASRAIGFGIFERLLLLSAELQSVASDQPVSETILASRLGSRFDQYTHRWFDAVLILRQSHSPLFVRGPSDTPGVVPVPTSAQAAELESGRIVLLTEPRTNRVWLLRGSSRSASRPLIVAVSVRSAHLFAMLEHDALPAWTEGCLFTTALLPLYCSNPSLLPLPSAVRERLVASASGDFLWPGPGAGYLASYWSLFLQSEFSAPKWVVVAAESRAGLAGQLSRFRTTLTLTALVAILIVLLLSSRHIRSTLQPIEELREGIRRLAGRNFQGRVAVSSRDEFEELAGAFNGMAGELASQFQTIETLGDVQQAILTALDAKGVVETALRRIHELSNASFVAAVLIDPAVPDRGLLFTRTGGPAGGVQIDRTNLPHDAVRSLTADAGEFDADATELAWLTPAIPAAIAYIAVLPLRISAEPAGLLTLGYPHRSPRIKEDIARARRVADQISVGLSSARMVEQVHTLAYYDQVTGLPNRRLMRDRLDRALRMAAQHGRRVAVLFLDLDHFKRINDTFGHTTGDRLLREVAVRLGRTVRQSDNIGRSDAEAADATISRLGGDEFTVVLTEIAHAEDPALVARRILQALDQPFLLGTETVSIAASIGISVFPGDGEDADTLVKNADTAMYTVKDQGRNAYRFYNPSMNAAVLERLTLETRLREALDEGALHLVFQPRWHLATGTVVGMEALIRWRDRQLGSVPPSRFIPIAEETGLIISIGSWVLRSACTQILSWQSAGYEPVPVAVNVSARQFQSGNFVGNLQALLTESGLPARLLTLELTESVLMRNADASAEELRDLKALGVSIAIDDFGTGYSSLSYLKRFPIDHLKIDQSFIRGLPAKADDAEITSAIVAMAHRLNLRVIAEGVESEEQRTWLANQGCDEIQGFLVGKPVSADEAARFLVRDSEPSSQSAA
jgi:diguanylate cyclase (GGDEF)-like protein